jgi:hypothetical protein
MQKADLERIVGQLRSAEAAYEENREVVVTTLF